MSSKLTDESVYTAKNQYRKFETNIPRKGIARPQSKFPHSCVCERFIYSHHQSAYSAAGKYVDRSWEYINRSQTHECGNWYTEAAQYPEQEYIRGIFVAVYASPSVLTTSSLTECTRSPHYLIISGLTYRVANPV
jgi:hypothetical protein